MQQMKRRKFLEKGSLVTLGFLGLQSYANSLAAFGANAIEEDLFFAHGYGSLKRDPKGIMNLPRGFSYKIISRRGDRMSDGLWVPGLGDGMGTFKGDRRNRTIIVRNHEVSPKDINNGAFGDEYDLLNLVSKEKFYDYGRGETPCLGGTTTMVFNNRTLEVERQWLSLAGTIRNCAGGVTPWRSWITCEESILKSNDTLEKNHGFNFEVPVTSRVKLHDPVPLKAMGRFNHEAVCVNPRTSIVYQTEDRPDGMIYRFIPNVPNKLHFGGKLQILAIKGSKSFDTRNWINTGAPTMKKGVKYEVEWLDIDDVESPIDDLRYRGRDIGGAIFARGEGIWFGENELYFACTNGGKKAQGQIFKYVPSEKEARADESSEPGTLELFLEPNSSYIVESCDNLTIADNGDLVVCEDTKEARIIGVTPKGKTYKIAHNVGYPSEFAGATFSPDGKVLFVNIQVPGITLAITGPWRERVS